VLVSFPVSFGAANWTTIRNPPDKTDDPAGLLTVDAIWWFNDGFVSRTSLGTGSV